MLKIRFRRCGARRKPFFRVVLTEHLRSTKGAVQKVLGFYDPRSKAISVNRDAIDYWKKRGAKLSDSVESMLKKYDKNNKKEAISGDIPDGGEKDERSSIADCESVGGQPGSG